MEFAGAMQMAICNTWFKKPEDKIGTYKSGGYVSMIDFLMVKTRDRRLVKNVKVISGEECVTQHGLVVGELRFDGLKRPKRRYTPKLRIWKMRDTEVRMKFRNKVKSMAELWKPKHHGSRVEEVWTEMKDILLQTSNETCGWYKGKSRHKDTWWWTPDVTIAVEEKRTAFKLWYDSRTAEARKGYVEAKKKAKQVIAQAKDIKMQDIASHLDTAEGKKNVFKIARYMAKERQDIGEVTCLRTPQGKITADEDQIKVLWKNYMEKLLNEENPWDNESRAEPVSGPCCWIGRQEIKKAIKKSKKGKAAGPSGVVSEMIEAADELGVDWLTDLCNAIIGERKIPEDWQQSITVPIYKGKGDPLECGSYRGIRLLEQAMKITERVLEQRIREMADIDNMQFGFRPGRSTTDAIFIVRQVQEKYLAKGKALYHAFVDLEKAFDRVPRAVVRWALRKAKVEEWLVQAVMAMYKGASTVVRTNGGNTSSFEVKVGVHQGSVLSPLLFIIVMDVLSRNCKEGLPFELLYADDLVITADTEQQLVQKLKRWKESMEHKGMKVNMGKTKVMVSGMGIKEVSGKWPCGVCRKGVGANSVQCTRCQKWVHKKCSGVKGTLSKVAQSFVCRVCKGQEKDEIREKSLDMGDGTTLEWVGKFCYLGDMINANGGADSAVAARISAGWKKFREMLPFLTNKAVPLTLKVKVYKSCVRSCMLYGSETWAMKAEHERKMDRAEMRMIRWMCGVSLKEGRTNEELRATTDIEPIREALITNRLRWYGHVQRKEDTDWTKACTMLEVDGRRGRGRPHKTWLNESMDVRGLRPETAYRRSEWRQGIKFRRTEVEKNQLTRETGH